MSKDLLYEEIYQKTQSCGRTQFVKLLQQNQIRIEQLQKENKELEKYIKLCKKDLKTYQEYKSKYYDIKLILTKFEKWLEKEIEKENKRFNFCFTEDATVRQIEHVGYLDYVLKKFQKLKEGNNEKI